MNTATWQWAKANPDAAALRIRKLERENAALKADKERLDWCDRNQVELTNYEENEGGVLPSVGDQQRVHAVACRRDLIDHGFKEIVSIAFSHFDYIQTFKVQHGCVSYAL